ncbi:hypothetical protein E8E15_002100 [Penicillium rubens]|nr:hypothetical protein E8E15_002100 [Penicillium rubens]KAJ5050179.1 hypothetical protein NUH16_008719 [Penicillium rubens]
MPVMPPANADPRTEDDPPLPPANWLGILDRLTERWGWADTLALLAVVLVFSWVWRLSHGMAASISTTIVNSASCVALCLGYSICYEVIKTERAWDHECSRDVGLISLGFVGGGTLGYTKIYNVSGKWLSSAGSK